MKNLVTLAGRSKMAKARAGLAHELIKKEVSSITKVSDTCYRFSIVLGEAEMTDAEISEMALIDSEGDTVIVKTFKPKIKDAGMEMTFQMDDKF